MKISLFDWSILMSFVWSIRVYRQWKIIALFNCCLPSLRFLLFFFLGCYWLVFMVCLKFKWDIIKLFWMNCYLYPVFLTIQLFYLFLVTKLQLKLFEWPFWLLQTLYMWFSTKFPFFLVTKFSPVLQSFLDFKSAIRSAILFSL